MVNPCQQSFFFLTCIAGRTPGTMLRGTAGGTTLPQQQSLWCPPRPRTPEVRTAEWRGLLAGYKGQIKVQHHPRGGARGNLDPASFCGATCVVVPHAFPITAVRGPTQLLTLRSGRGAEWKTFLCDARRTLVRTVVRAELPDPATRALHQVHGGLAHRTARTSRRLLREGGSDRGPSRAGNCKGVRARHHMGRVALK